MRLAATLALLVISAGMGWSAAQLGPPVDLLDGLESGPRGVDVSPGTQFWAQTSGRQGQTSLGRTQVDLSGQQYAQVWIPTACTNFNLRAPTEEHVMDAYPCPNADMARLCDVPALWGFSRPSIQLAVWAVANDPSPARLRGYLRDQARASEGTLTVAGIVDGAAALLGNAGLEPGKYAMFR